MISLMLICVAYILIFCQIYVFIRNIEDLNMICNQNIEYLKVIVSIFYQNQMDLNMGLRTLPFCVMKVFLLVNTSLFSRNV